LLSVHHLDVAVGPRVILQDIDLAVGVGQTHVLFGPNGSGKSSLLAALMGLPPYRVTRGEILFDGQRIDTLPTHARAQLGLGMSFQRPPALEGVTVRALAEALGAQARLEHEAEALDLAGFASRDINVGFSGGEIKRWEILKLFLQRPRLCLFDEPESGVDLEHIAAVGAAIERLLATGRPAGERRSALIITHTGFILDYLQADVGHLLVNGRLIGSDEPRHLFQHIKRHGYSIPTTSAAAWQTTPERG